MNPFSYLQ